MRPFAAVLTAGTVLCSDAYASHKLPPPASAEEKDAATVIYLSCLREQVVKLDDGLSDASTVALAVAPACRKQLHDLVGVTSRNYNDRVKSMIFEDQIKEEQNRATAVVLQERVRLKTKQNAGGLQGRSDREEKK